MKKLALLLILSFFHLAVSSQESDDLYVIYADSNADSRVLISNQALKSQPLRLYDTESSNIKSRNGMITVTVVNNNGYLTFGMENCMRMAIDTWEEKLKLTQPIVFYLVSDDNLPQSLELKTTVHYSLDGRTSMPRVMYSQLKGVSIVSEDTIMVNSYIDWNSSRSIIEPVSNGDNLITAFMRHIAHMFGFGTSLDYRLGGLGFMVGGRNPSVFDKLVVNSEGVNLASLALGGASKIEEYMKQPLFLKTNSGFYKLYSDARSYVRYRSGNYFSIDKENLMNYPYRDATKKLPIDSEMLDVLKSMGWTINNDNDCAIKSSNMDIFGYGSVYAPFVFNLYNDSGIENNNNIQWTFQLFSNAQNKYVDISSKKGSSFAVNQTTIQSDYLDKSGLQHGRIVAEINGKRYTQLLFLEARPCLTDCKITYRGDTEPDFYGIDVELSYLGATSGYIYVYNDFGVTSFDYEFSGKNTSKIYIPDVLKFGKSTLEITLQNEFGESNQSVAFDFSQKSSRVNNELLSVGSKQTPMIEGKMYVYNFQGRCVLVTDNTEETLSLPQGYYIVRSKDINSRIIHIK